MAYVAIVYQTFLTRSGVLADQSVHSFVDLGLYGQLLLYILVMTFMGVGFYLYRYKDLPSPREESKFLSREFMTFTGSMLLLILGIIIIVGTSSPIIGRFFVDNPTPPEIQFYNDWSMPVAIIMAFATVLGQYLFWQKHTWESLAGAMITPLLITSTATVVSIVLGEVSNIYYMIYIFAGWFTVIGNSSILISLIRKKPKLIGGTLTHIGFGALLLGIIASSAYTGPLLDQRTSSYNARVAAGEVYDEEGFPVTQPREMFSLDLNRPTLINNEYMVTYEGYDLSDTPRPGQQTYRLRFESIDNGRVFYMFPEVYPMLTTSSRTNIEWSVDPHVQTGWMSDYYLYVAGSKYVEQKNEELEEQNRNLDPLVSLEEDADERQTIEIDRGEVINAGPFSFTFMNFTPAQETELPENTQIGIRSLVRVTHTPSGNAFDVEPLFAVYTEDEVSYTYSPPLEIERWGMTISFTRIFPESDSIELTVDGLDMEFEEDWVLIVAEEKPFVSVVWLGTFLLMGGFTISIFRHWSREKNTEEKD